MTNCHRLKLLAADGKRYLTDVASPETLLRIIQSVPSPRAEPIKLWLVDSFLIMLNLFSIGNIEISNDSATVSWTFRITSPRWFTLGQMP